MDVPASAASSTKPTKTVITLGFCPRAALERALEHLMPNLMPKTKKLL